MLQQLKINHNRNSRYIPPQTSSSRTSVIYESCDVTDTGRKCNWAIDIHNDVRFDEDDIQSIAYRNLSRQEFGARGLPEDVRTTKRKLPRRGVLMPRGQLSWSREESLLIGMLI